ncbi:tyrosyl-trna synthetase [Fusarium heterosporum]|uniref:tyrosine--tRNA ligase n=1 Tax=Fusarium heterosporum TaxID=42747 RepID=A0A8H5TKB6_FUSHE|nr:tyrosyl-trna synthetase [Fusarium heterosporum]
MMSPEESITLIEANIAEVLHSEIIDDVVLNKRRPLRVYWGTATTGKLHCGCFVPIVKIAELLKAGCHVKILLADIHAYMDNMKAPFELIAYRCEYYRFLIQSMLRSIGIDISTAKLEFVVGSSYQWDKEYTIDSRRLEAITKLSAAKKAGAQALDEEYLDVDAQLGGVDQRKIFTFASEALPKLGYKKRAHLMNTMVPGLGDAEKMSSSEPNSKIDILDTSEMVEKKLRKAVCIPKRAEGNGLIAFVGHVIFRVASIKLGKPRFVIEQSNGVPLVYEDIRMLEKDFEQDVVTPQMIKAALTKTLYQLLEPIRRDFRASEEWQRVSALGYPPEEERKSSWTKVERRKSMSRRVPTMTATPCLNEQELSGSKIPGQ